MLKHTRTVAAPVVPVIDPSQFPQQPAPFLLELGVEELPVQDLDGAMEQLRTNAPQMFANSRLSFDDVQVFGTPRRLAVAVRGLAPRQPDEERVIKGPPADFAFDKAGQPTKAALGFARGQGISVSALQKREYEGKNYVVAVKLVPGQPAAEVLADLLLKLVGSLKFGKVMHWNESGATFSRAIRWIVALLGDQVVPLTYAGVVSGRITRGLRPLDSPAIEIPDAAAFLSTMEANSIAVDPDKRQQNIQTRVAELAASVGGYTPDDPLLLREVTHLVEWPTPLLGHFAEEFLQLPQEVLIAVMKKHQRYFPIMKDGQLLPYFVTVANGPYEHLDPMRHGYEEVLRARYSDAAFFYKADTGKKLEDFVPRLSSLTFQEKLGSVLDKVRRVEDLVPRLAEMIGASDSERQAAVRAAHLCKADLATQMVVELTSLQGIMGAKYATLSGEEPAVAQAIYEHYLPRGASDALPQSMAGTLVGLADHLDSLVGLFAVGLSPTGSADPYGLRRAALGLVQILAEKGISLSLREAFRTTAALLPVGMGDTELLAVQEFVAQRLRGWLLELGYRYDLVDATLAERADDPSAALATVRSLSEWASRPEFGTLLTAYSRPSRITRELAGEFRLSPETFTEEAEQTLYQAMLVAQQERASVQDVDGLMAILRPLARPIDKFFDQVFVMIEDRAVRENRLALLQRIAALSKGIVDLTQVLGY